MSHLYAFAINIDGVSKIKVGWSASLDKRLGQYACMYGGAPTLFAKARGTRLFEKQVHDELSEWKLHGEWYDDVDECRLTIERLFKSDGRFEEKEPVKPANEFSRKVADEMDFYVSLLDENKTDWPDGYSGGGAFWAWKYRNERRSVSIDGLYNTRHTARAALIARAQRIVDDLSRLETIYREDREATIEAKNLTDELEKMEARLQDALRSLGKEPAVDPYWFAYEGFDQHKTDGGGAA